MRHRREPRAAAGDTARERAMQRLEQLEQRLDQPPFSAGEAADVLHELQAALEEVRVADEELAAQNEELLAAREALEAERHRYQRLFDSAPDGYLATDLGGKILDANRAASELLNTSVKTLAGKPLVVFVSGHDRAAFRSLLARLGAGERVSDWEVALQPRDGSPITALLTAAPEPSLWLGSGAAVSRLLWIVRDVSVRKATEEALRESEERLRHSQRLEAVGRLAGGIAHSFNNLLAAIVFHSELLVQGLGEESPLAAHIEEIQ